MRSGIKEKHTDKRRTVGVFGETPVQFDIGITNIPDLFQGHTFVRMDFLGPNRHEEMVKFTLHFAGVYAEMGEFGN